MIRVILESPFGADPDKFIPYGRACISDSLSLGEAPMAMHLLYTQPGVLDDTDKEQRIKGMEAAFSWYDAAQYVVVYRDFGISSGMQTGIQLAESLGLAIHYRSLKNKETPDGAIFRPFPSEEVNRRFLEILHGG